LTAGPETEQSPPGEAENPTTNQRKPYPSHLHDRTIRRRLIMNGNGFALVPKWYTVAQVARLLGYGESKVRMLIIAGDLRSLKDGRSRRILPEWVDEYIQMRASQTDATWWSR
jgi:excisionase family DNA binding protein